MLILKILIIKVSVYSYKKLGLSPIHLTNLITSNDPISFN